MLSLSPKDFTSGKCSKECSICREDFQQGDQLRVLPCLHKELCFLWVFIVRSLAALKMRCNKVTKAVLSPSGVLLGVGWMMVVSCHAI